MPGAAAEVAQLDSNEVRCPADFEPTHATAGLDGFPAIDVFGKPGARVSVGFWGYVSRVSGRSPSEGGVPGGAYGWSVYITNRVNGRVRYVTHLGSRSVVSGDRVKPGSIIGTVCDSAVSGKPGTSHVHLGMKR